MGSLARLAREAKLFRALRGRRYGLIVHLCDDPRGAWLACTLRPRYSVAPERRGRAWKRSFTHLYLVAARRPAVEADLDALRRIGIQPEPAERRVSLVPGAEAERSVAAVVEGDFVQVHLASRVAAWPAARQAALIDRLGAAGGQVVLTGERDFADEVLRTTRSTPLDLAGRLSLKELGALAARARTFYGAEGIALELACAAGTPVMLLCALGEEAPWRPWDSGSAGVRELAGTA
jgi:heptosyltransferase-3